MNNSYLCTQEFNLSMFQMCECSIFKEIWKINSLKKNTYLIFRANNRLIYTKHILHPVTYQNWFQISTTPNTRHKVMLQFHFSRTRFGGNPRKPNMMKTVSIICKKDNR